MNGNDRYFGKYRGTVSNNIDPLKIGRIQIVVPDVLGLAPSTWAMPCLPIAGKQMGMYAIPQIGDGVWVEFEQGDPDYPVWVGCWWGAEKEVPALASLVTPPIQNVVIQTTGQNSIQMSDVPGPTGGIVLKSKSGAMISINDKGIVISNGKGAIITMDGPTITVNNGALSIT